MVGLSFWMNDSKVDAPTMSPAIAKTVLGLPLTGSRRPLTAPAMEAAPAVALYGSSRRRPWKSLDASTWTVSRPGGEGLTGALMPTISGLWSEDRKGVVPSNRLATL